MPVSYPYGFSCWYGYDKDCSTLTSFSASTSSSFSGVCIAIVNQTYYHDGSGTFPAQNDKVYTSSAGGSSNYLGTGYYRFDVFGTDRFFQIGINGTVSSVSTCGGGGGGGGP